MFILVISCFIFDVSYSILEHFPSGIAIFGNVFGLVYLFNYTIIHISLTLSINVQMKAKLRGGHFRMLNEKLYTCRFTNLFSFVFFYGSQFLL